MAYSAISNIYFYITDSGNPVLTLSDDVAKINVSNELSYQSSPTRSNDMTLRNDEEAFYVPTVKLTFSYLTPETFSKLMQIVNSKGFFVKYFDYELGEEVFRAVYASERSLDQLHTKVNATLEGLVGVNLTLVSRYGYAYTKSSDANCTEANKYHMYQLHAHNAQNNYNPTSEGAPDYV